MVKTQPENINETDWESVFESPDMGFIALVEQAQTVKALQQCTGLIIDQLFSRKDDAPFLVAYRTALDEFFPTEDGDDVDVSFSKKRVTALLRDVKHHRQRKAAEHSAQSGMKQGKADDVGDEGSDIVENRLEKAPPTMPGLTEADAETPPEEEKAAVVEETADDIVDLFGDVFCNALGERFKALYEPTEQKREPGDMLPFILSEDFARHFEEIIRRQVIPSILESSRGLVKLILEQPQDERQRYLSNYMESRNGRQVLWEKWQDAWKEKCQQTSPPPKPKPKKKKGLMDIITLKKEKKVPAWKREKTPEEWQEIATKIKKENEISARIWAEIAIDTGSWLPPDESDGKLLMDMFARSIVGLQKQVSGLNQIVGQGDNVSRLLTAFVRGKDIDLALLAACYQNYDAFIGKKIALKEMMIGFTQKEVDQDFAMVSRYLGKHF